MEEDLVRLYESLDGFDRTDLNHFSSRALNILNKYDVERAKQFFNKVLEEEPKGRFSGKDLTDIRWRRLEVAIYMHVAGLKV